MILQKVTGRKTEKRFLDAARFVYRDDPTWVCPLDNDIRGVFDPAVNPYFGHGTAERWVVISPSGDPCGRIAAFIDHHLSGSYEQPTGGIGFFECTNDRETAFLLFDTARNWLAEKGMEAMDGPVNFGETDKFWGLLVGGFTHPSFDVPYNPPYYRELFESYGFRIYYKMEGFHLDITRPLPERFTRIAERVVGNAGFSFRHFSWKEEESCTYDFAVVFNQAWASFKKHFKPLEPVYIRATLKKAKPILEEEFIWLAYYHGRPVGIFLMFPDMNQILKHLNGKLGPAGILKFLWLKQRKTMTRAKGLLMGVIPGFQNRGIESAFIYNLAEVFRRKPWYREIEFSWVADFNPKMKKLFLAVGCEPVKQYITYRYLFDRNKIFRRYPIPGDGGEEKSGMGSL